MTEAQLAHFEESQIPFDEFVKSIDYTGKTPVQQKFGDEGLEYVYGRRTAPKPKDAAHFDTYERITTSYWEKFDPTQTDWYPDATKESIEKDTKITETGSAVVALVLRAA